jgi:hypothetical protein
MEDKLWRPTLQKANTREMPTENPELVPLGQRFVPVALATSGISITLRRP